MDIKTESLWIETVKGSRRISNFLWASVVFLGALGFILVGLSSYFGKDIIPFLQTESIAFTPQGLVMLFYGIAGLFLSIYLWCIIVWSIGSGYNEFDRLQGIVSIFRWGFPGKNRRIRIRCLVEDIQAIRLEVNDNLLSRRMISIKLKGQQDIPLTQMGEAFTLSEMEEKAAQLARFLRVPIEGL
jgi:Ycf4